MWACCMNWLNNILTALLWFQNIYAGGSGEFSITHVKFMVDPLSMYKSGAPIISVDGSAACNISMRRESVEA